MDSPTFRRRILGSCAGPRHPWQPAKIYFMIYGAQGKGPLYPYSTFICNSRKSEFEEGFIDVSINSVGPRGPFEGVMLVGPGESYFELAHRGHVFGEMFVGGRPVPGDRSCPRFEDLVIRDLAKRHTFHVDGRPVPASQSQVSIAMAVDTESRKEFGELSDVAKFARWYLHCADGWKKYDLD